MWLFCILIFLSLWNSYWRENPSYFRQNGQIFAFNLETDELKSFSNCQLQCNCEITLEELQTQFRTEENEKDVPLFKPAFSDTCFVTKFIRKSSYGILNQTNYSCEKFLQSIQVRLKANLLTNHSERTKNLLICKSEVVYFF